MSLSAAIVAHLGRTAKVTALVPASRIYRVTGPQGHTTPAILVQKISGASDQHQRGACSSAEARVQITVLANSASVADAIVKQIRLCTDGFAGSIGTAGNRITVERMQIEDDGESYTPGSGGQDSGYHDQTMDLRVWYRVEVPAMPA